MLRTKSPPNEQNLNPRPTIIVFVLERKTSWQSRSPKYAYQSQATKFLTRRMKSISTAMLNSKINEIMESESFRKCSRSGIQKSIGTMKASWQDVQKGSVEGQNGRREAQKGRSEEMQKVRRVQRAERSEMTGRDVSQDSKSSEDWEAVFARGVSPLEAEMAQLLDAEE